MSDAPQRYQVVLCDGPRCRARRQLGRHVEQLRVRIAGCDAERRVGVATYACLGRCPAGPNLVVRELAPTEALDRAPGLFDLDGSCHYHHVTSELIERVVDEHCQGHPIAGRYQRY